MADLLKGIVNVVEQVASNPAVEEQVESVLQNPWIEEQVAEVTKNPDIVNMASQAANSVIQGALNIPIELPLISTAPAPSSQTKTPAPAACVPVAPIVTYDREVADFGMAVSKLNVVQAEAESKTILLQQTNISTFVSAFKNIPSYELALKELIQLQPGVLERYRELSLSFASLKLATVNGTGDKNAMMPYENAVGALADFTSRIVKVEGSIEELVVALTSAKTQELNQVVFIMFIIAIVVAAITATVTYALSSPPKIKQKIILRK